MAIGNDNVPLLNATALVNRNGCGNILQIWHTSANLQYP